MRYAEVLLMQAEAAAESSTSDVTGPLNRVRNRAICNTTATGQVALRAAIRAERRHEWLLSMIDGLISLEQVKLNQLWLLMENFCRRKHELFPIPQNSSHKLMEKRHKIQDIN
jgi:hypothetical protein